MTKSRNNCLGELWLGEYPLAALDLSQMITLSRDEGRGGVQGQNQAPTAVSKPLRILALDGGGVRGLSSLLILEHMMVRLAIKRRKNEEDSELAIIRPCEVFDLIIGTNTGGQRTRVTTHDKQRLTIVRKS